MRKLILLFLIYTQPLLAGDNDHPNIFIFLSDDHGAEDIRHYGNSDLSTPVLDRWAEEGMVFPRAYTSTSVCAPSRATLFTGMYPHRNGCDQNHGEIGKGIRTLPDYIKPLGYRVILAGKKHIEPEAQFDFEYVELDSLPALLKEGPEEPFCIIVSLHSPHQPYFNHKGGTSDITPKIWMPDTDPTRRYTAAYYDHVRMLDYELGAYQYWINEFGYSDALQIYLSDHGPAFPFAKWSLYENGIRIPLIVKWPGKIAPGSVQNNLVSMVDILPTIVEIAGARVPHPIDGESLVPLFDGPVSYQRPYVYAAYTNLGVKGANEYPIRAIISEDWKLIVNLRYQDEFHIARMDLPDERAVIDSYDVLQSWLDHDSEATRQRALQHWQRPALELFHLAQDPHEMNNLSMMEDHAPILHSMVAELISWMTVQDDPLIDDINNLMYEFELEEE